MPQKFEEITLKDLITYIGHRFETGKKRKFRDRDQIARQFILDAIEPKNRSKYLNAWTNDFQKVAQVLEKNDFSRVIKKITSSRMDERCIYLHRFETNLARFILESKFDKSFEEILRYYHKDKILSDREISKEIIKETRIYISHTQINKYLKRIGEQKRHYIQMKDRYAYGKHAQPKGVIRMKSPNTKKWNRKRQIFIALNDELYEDLQKAVKSTNKCMSEFVQDIFQVAGVDIARMNTTMSRPEIIAKLMRTKLLEIKRCRKKFKKEITIIVKSASAHRASCKKSNVKRAIDLKNV